MKLNIGNLPETKVNEALQAWERRDYTYLIKITNMYNLLPHKICCRGAKLQIDQAWGDFAASLETEKNEENG